MIARGRCEKFNSDPDFPNGAMEKVTSDESRSPNQKPRVSLKIHGFECDPSQITGILGLKADRILRKGDVVEISRPGTRLTAKANQWKLDAPPSDSPMIEDHIEPLVAILEMVAGKIQGLPAGSVCEIDVAVYATDADELPGIYLDPKLLDRIARLRLALSVSIY